MNDICSFRGMVWGVDWIRLVGVGVGIGIKIPRGVIGSGKMHFWYHLNHSEESGGSEIGWDEGREE